MTRTVLALAAALAVFGGRAEDSAGFAQYVLRFPYPIALPGAEEFGEADVLVYDATQVSREELLFALNREGGPSAPEPLGRGRCAADGSVEPIEFSNERAHPGMVWPVYVAILPDRADIFPETATGFPCKRGGFISPTFDVMAMALAVTLPITFPDLWDYSQGPWNRRVLFASAGWYGLLDDSDAARAFRLLPHDAARRQTVIDGMADAAEALASVLVEPTPGDPSRPQVSVAAYRGYFAIAARPVAGNGAYEITCALDPEKIGLKASVSDLGGWLSEFLAGGSDVISFSAKPGLWYQIGHMTDLARPQEAVWSEPACCPAGDSTMEVEASKLGATPSNPQGFFQLRVEP